MKKFRILITLAAFTLISFANAVAGEFSLGTDIMSRYVWRGTDFGNSPSIQPSLEFSHNNFTVGTWGAYAINSDANYQELDLYISYTIADMLTIGVTDYFFPGIDGETMMWNNYFDYDNDLTGHVLEANLGFACKKIPLTLSVNTAFYGDDKKEEIINEETGEVETSANFSTYIELGYGGTLKEVDWNVFLGITPAEGLYGDDFGIVNMGLGLAKEIKITDSFSLPISSQLIFNPQAENAFFVFGISL
jgi:hypothetical protein